MFWLKFEKTRKFFFSTGQALIILVLWADESNVVTKNNSNGYWIDSLYDYQRMKFYDTGNFLIFFYFTLFVYLQKTWKDGDEIPITDLIDYKMHDYTWHAVMEEYKGEWRSSKVS